MKPYTPKSCARGSSTTQRVAEGHWLLVGWRASDVTAPHGHCIRHTAAYGLSTLYTHSWALHPWRIHRASQARMLASKPRVGIGRDHVKRNPGLEGGDS